jgi:hypothetical protein
VLTVDTSRFQSLQTKAFIARVALGATLLYWVFEAVTVVLFVGSPGTATQGFIDLATRVETTYLLLVVVTAVSFVVWSFGAHANLARLGREGIRHRDAATIWWWILPVALLFMPYRVIGETVRGSVAPLGDPDWRTRRLPALVGWWTALFIAGQIVGQAGTVLSLSAVTDAELDYALVVIGFGALLLIGAAVTALVLVSRVTEAQARHADALALLPPAPLTV